MITLRTYYFYNFLLMYTKILNGHFIFKTKSVNDLTWPTPCYYIFIARHALSESKSARESKIQ